MFVAASTRCFSDKSFAEACFLLDDLEYEKVELWFDEEKGPLRPSEVVAEADNFFNRYREITRLAPIAFSLESDVSPEVFSGLAKLAKLFRIAQITVPASKLGTPFNAEIDRLRAFVNLGSQEAVRVSIKTRNGHLTQDPNTAIELCQAVPKLGLTLDPSYYVCGPHRDASYDQVFPYVYHVHLRDSTPTQVQVPLGLGEIDYSRLISQLSRSQDVRSLTVEIFPELLEESARAIELRKIRLLLESLL